MSAEIFSYSIAAPSRANGFNAVVHAAYVSGERLLDDTENRTYSMGAKDRIVHKEIAIPENSPQWVREVALKQDRERLWNMAEAAERRSDAQVYRRVILAIDDGLFASNERHELDVRQSVEMQTRLVREHIERCFTSQGMIADWAIHWDKEFKNPHAHVILTRRVATEEGFARWKDGQAEAPKKGEQPQRPWNDRGHAERWRTDWAETQNRALEAMGLPYRLDHRSYERRGIDLEPTEKHFGSEEKQEENRKLREAEADRLIGNPRPLFDLMSQSFVADLQEKDLEHYATRFAPEGDEARRAALLKAMKESKELIALPDGKYTTQGIVAKQAREQLKDVIGRVAEAKDWAELDRELAGKGWQIEQAERRGKVVYDLARADDPARRVSAFRVDEQLGPKALERLGERPIEPKPEPVIEEPAPPAGDDREKKGTESGQGRPPKKGEAAPPEVPGAAADTKSDEERSARETQAEVERDAFRLSPVDFEERARAREAEHGARMERWTAKEAAAKDEVSQKPASSPRYGLTEADRLRLTPWDPDALARVREAELAARTERWKARREAHAAQHGRQDALPAEHNPPVSAPPSSPQQDPPMAEEVTEAEILKECARQHDLFMEARERGDVAAAKTHYDSWWDARERIEELQFGQMKQGFKDPDSRAYVDELAAQRKAIQKHKRAELEAVFFGSPKSSAEERESDSEHRTRLERQLTDEDRLASPASGTTPPAADTVRDIEASPSPAATPLPSLGKEEEAPTMGQPVAERPQLPFEEVYAQLRLMEQRKTILEQAQELDKATTAHMACCRQAALIVRHPDYPRRLQDPAFRESVAPRIEAHLLRAERERAEELRASATRAPLPGNSPASVQPAKVAEPSPAVRSESPLPAEAPRLTPGTPPVTAKVHFSGIEAAPQAPTSADPQRASIPNEEKRHENQEEFARRLKAHADLDRRLRETGQQETKKERNEAAFNLTRSVRWSEFAGDPANRPAANQIERHARESESWWQSQAQAPNREASPQQGKGADRSADHSADRSPNQGPEPGQGPTRSKR